MSKTHEIQLNFFDSETSASELTRSPAAEEVSQVSAQAAPVDVPIATQAKPAAAPAKASAPSLGKPLPARESAAPRDQLQNQFLSDRAVAARYHVSRPTIWRWVKARAGFPQPLAIGEGTTRWRLGDLIAFEQTLAWSAGAPPGGSGPRGKGPAQ
ncbi:hypothetical protein AQS8620_01164 [Aquimixticola soesokkakensis]|uniref:Prophage CP4-57 regulatory protein (AlpA) n=1 Tax=Aquimixticola soesokkakensis TaxID=1519096 RepID=A0A1Y5SCF5_9RHOB|nr:helix-turn-helix domain-containing protein [Aquimixticola soesokkakensis]SLN34764.1 hypothetical protein AQS8620_01164 [Aquimixticola soesokkakensis]